MSFYRQSSVYRKPGFYGSSDDPNSTMSVLSRINKYLYWANEHASKRDIKAWYMQLENLYRELYWHMNDKERTKVKELLPKVSKKVSAWEKAFRTSGFKVRTVDDEAVLVNELDLFLRSVAHRKKFQLKDRERKPEFYDQ